MTIIKTLLAAIPLLFLVLPGYALEPPKPLSTAEVAAVEMAADFLTRGADAFVERISPESSWSGLTPDRARDQIETRTGPAKGAIWELQTPDGSLDENSVVFSVIFPSGIEDLLVVDLEPTGESFGVASIRSLSDSGGIGEEVQPGAPAVQRATAIPSTWDIVRRHSRAGAIGLGIMFLGFAIVTRQHLRIAIPSVVTGLLFLGGAYAGSMMSGAVTEDARAGRVDPSDVELSRSELRKRIASGEAIELSSIDRSDQQMNVWLAQYHVAAGRVTEATEILDEFPRPSPIPLVDLLRARIALSESDAAGAGVAYDRVLSSAPFSEDLWTEAAEACLMSGYQERGEAYIDRLMEARSRSARPYYRASSLAVVDQRSDKAETLLRRAIELEPAPRSELVAEGYFWEFLRRGEIAEMVQLYQPEEPKIRSAHRDDGRHFAIGDNWSSYEAGELLYLKDGSQKLIVPGGARHAPPGTENIDAVSLQRLEAEELLPQSGRLIEVARSGNSWNQPALRRRLELLCHALADENRWTELIQLTDRIAIESTQQGLDPHLYRMIALKQMKREDEARTLAAHVALAELKRSSPNASNLYQLGEVLSLFGDYEIAIKLLQRASTISDTTVLDDRIRQLEMNQTLSADYLRKVTDHFDIRYSHGTSPRLVSKLAEVLEAERARLAPMFEGVNLPMIRVHILPFHDFQSVYTHSNQVVGFFDGAIHLPFAEVVYLTPPIVAILTHELVHAFVSEATRGNAPAWLQEGVAQRFEMVPASSNAFNRYDRDSLLSLSVLDATIRFSPDPGMTSAAYVVSATFIRFLQERYGSDVVHRLTSEYSRGTRTETVFRNLFDKEMQEVDRDFRQWGWEKQRLFLNPEPAVYDRDPSTEVQWQRGRPRDPYTYPRRY